MYSALSVVSVRLVEAENLDWCLFRVSDQRLIKWYRKSCHIYIQAQFAFKMGHANFPSCISCLHTTLYLPLCYHRTGISYLSSIENPPNVHQGIFWNFEDMKMVEPLIWDSKEASVQIFSLDKSRWDYIISTGNTNYKIGFEQCFIALSPEAQNQWESCSHGFYQDETALTTV